MNEVGRGVNLHDTDWISSRILHSVCAHYMCHEQTPTAAAQQKKPFGKKCFEMQFIILCKTILLSTCTLYSSDKQSGRTCNAFKCYIINACGHMIISRSKSSSSSIKSIHKKCMENYWNRLNNKLKEMALYYSCVRIVSAFYFTKRLNGGLISTYPLLPRNQRNWIYFSF